MSDRVLRSRVRNGPTSVSVTEEKEKLKFSSARRRSSHKEVVVQNLLNTVAQERFKHTQQQTFRKRVVFSKKRYTSDDLTNGWLLHAAAPDATATPIVGILKHSTPAPAAVEQASVTASSTPKATRRSRSRPRQPRPGRVSKHASFTEEARASPWTSASASILAALALSPAARQRAKQAERVASEDESVRRAVSFYKSSGDYWDVFPKTDYTYSPLSKHRREISPGVMTLPNMSRPGLHTPVFHQTKIGEAEISPSHLDYDAFHSDSDEEVFSRNIRTFRRNVRRNIWSDEDIPVPTGTWISNVIWTAIMSVVTFISSVTRSVSDYSSTLISRKQKPAFVTRPVRYHSYRPHQESLFSRMRSQCHDVVSNIFQWMYMSLSVSSMRLSRHKKKSWFMLLVPLLIFIGWWYWDGSSVTGAVQKIPHVIESASNEIIAIVSYPFAFIHSIIAQFWGIVVSVATYPLGLLSYTENLRVFLLDVAYSPLKLFQSLLDLLVSFCGSVGTFLHLIFSPVLTFLAAARGTAGSFQTASQVHMAMDSEMIKDIVDAALRKQEASLLAKMSETEKSMRLDLLSKIEASEGVGEQLNAKVTYLLSKIEASEGVGQQLNAKVAYLQDQLRRLRSRYVSCCKQPASVQTDAVKADIWEQLKNFMQSPEGLLLLGAAAVHSTPADKNHSNVPQFNDTEIRAWISSAFLDKDDFEAKIVNITKHLNDELDRRSQDSQILWAKLSELQSRLSDSLSNRNDPNIAGFASSFVGTKSFDESSIRRIVDSALALYDADKTGMADYALESQGGQVVSTRCTETYQVKSPTLSVFGVPLWYPSNSPRTVIQPGMHPGECWAFVGSQGYLVIQLSHRIRVTGFTYEHISPVLLPTGKMDSAPREFSVYGLRTEGDAHPILLGDYHYLQNSTSMQYFSVQRPGVEPLQLIEIQVKSNHGNINYTCMYRIRVHGSIA